jgi:3-oxoadipate enol-lactonase
MSTTEKVERWIEVSDGTRLYVESEGDGPAVLLIQGLGYASWAWQQQRRSLAQRHRIISFDNRGAGQSDKPDQRYTIGLLAQDAHAVLAALDATPAHVAGFSMGGYIALTLAAQHPAKVLSLVLLATTCGGRRAQGVPDSTRLAWQDAVGLPPAEFARATMPFSFAPDWVEEHAQEFDALLRSRLTHPTPQFAWKRQFDACEHFLAEGLTTLPAQPALIIHGTLDRVVPVANAHLLAETLPSAELALLDGAGHLALIEQSETVNQLIERFLESSSDRLREQEDDGVAR